MKYKTKYKIRVVLAIGMLVMVVALLCAMPFMGGAIAEEATSGMLDVIAEPLTWEYLATTGGCAAVVLLFVQGSKGFVDKFLPMPTELYAYIISVITLLVATYFSAGLTLSNGLLTLFNGWVVACTAKRAFDLMARK